MDNLWRLSTWQKHKKEVYFIYKKESVMPIKKYLKSMYLLLFIIAAICTQNFLIPETSANKEVENLPVIRYYQGKLESDYLPYYKKFVISGSTKLHNYDADIVKLNVEINKDYCWVRPYNDTTTEFRIVVDKLEKLGKEYKLIFSFYTNPFKNKDFVKNIANNLIENLEKKFKSSSSITLDEIKKEAAEELKKAVDNKCKDISKESQCYQISGNNCPTIMQQGCSTKEFDFSTPVAELLMDFLSKDLLFNYYDVQYKNARVKFEECYDENKKNESDEILKEMNEKIKNENDQGKKGKMKKDLKDFKEALAEPEKAPEKLVDRIKENWGTLYADHKSFLSDIISKIDNIRTPYRIKEEKKKEIAEIKGGDDPDKIRTKLMNEFEIALSDFYIESYNNIRVGEVTWTNETEIKRLRISSMFGYGACALSSSETQLDGFAYMGVKVRLGPVDRKIEKPYPYFRSRLSLSFGTVFKSDITYKGQKQDKAVGGIQPMIGINYDIDRWLGINCGFLFFRQPNINPLAVDKKKIRMALYLGVSFDIDIFNEIRDWFGNEKK